MTQHTRKQDRPDYSWMDSFKFDYVYSEETGKFDAVCPVSAAALKEMDTTLQSGYDFLKQNGV